MVMELVGPSLKDLWNRLGRHKTFSLKTVLILADQIISRMEYIHGKNILHRDIKPNNFMMGLGDKSGLVYVIDFGLAINPIFKTAHRKHPCPFTPRFASINFHLGISYSKRDDLEAIGYMFIYFMKGKLPWQGIKSKTREEREQKIGEMKMSTSPAVLCEGLPDEFMTYINYCRSLRYEEKPDYAFLRQLFHNVFNQQGFSNDNDFDWSNMVK